MKREPLRIVKHSYPVCSSSVWFLENSVLIFLFASQWVIEHAMLGFTAAEHGRPKPYRSCCNNSSLLPSTSRSHPNYPGCSLHPAYWNDVESAAPKGSLCVFNSELRPLVLWCCWLCVRKSIRPVKIWVMRCLCGYLLEWSASSLHMVQLMPLPPHHVCFSKNQNGLSFWYRLTWVVPDTGSVGIVVVT